MSEDLFSVKDVAAIFALQEARLRYWTQTGFVGPSERRRGRQYYTFRDLIAVKTAKELLDGGMPLQRVRKQLEALRAALPRIDRPLARLRVCSDGDNLVVLDDQIAFEPASGQVVMAFAIEALSLRAAEVLALPAAEAPAADHDTDPGEGATAYRCFLDGRGADEAGDGARAEAAYRRAIGLDPALAAAHTNLGNLLHRRGDLTGARAAYERALEVEPEQPEARFNLGNVLEDLGERELAVAELRRVATHCPEFADAHYNLAVALIAMGGVVQARAHLKRYLELDPDSPWAAQARAHLAALGPD